jgi:predicted DNA-binding transcriptional regulator
MKNLNDRRIYNYLVNEMNISLTLSTKVTNTQIAKDLDISVFTVRDKIIKMVKKGYLNSQNDYFDESNKYVQRKITKGSIEPSML